MYRYDVRKAVPHDIPNIATLLHEYDLFEYSLDSTIHIASRRTHITSLHKKMRTKSFAAFVAVADNQIIGIVHGEVITSEGTRLGIIQNTYVLPEHQSHGVGKLLVNQLLTWLRKHPIDRIQSFVYAANRDAFEFWKKQGFTVRGHQISLPIK